MEPLHLAMMRALWIWRTHEMRLKASCNQVARACWSSRAILDRNALRVGPTRPRVSRMAGVTTAGLHFVRFLLSAMVAALPTRPAASTQNGEVT